MSITENKHIRPHAEEFRRFCEIAPRMEFVKLTGSLAEGIIAALEDAARLRGESAQPDLHAHLLDMLGVKTHEEAGAEIGRLHGMTAQGEMQAVAWTSETQLKSVRLTGDGIMGNASSGWNVPLYTHPVSAQYTRPQPVAVAVDRLWVESRHCDSCNHAGINDENATLDACLTCEWSGPSPTEDRCPGCAREGCMGAACPKCGGRYELMASAEVSALSAAPAAPVHHIEKIAHSDCEVTLTFADWRKAHAYYLGNGRTADPVTAAPAPVAGDAGYHITVLREIRARYTESASPARCSALDAAIAALAQDRNAVAGDAVAKLPAKWLADMPSRDAQFGDRASSGEAAAYETCIDELEAALAQDRASQPDPLAELAGYTIVPTSNLRRIADELGVEGGIYAPKLRREVLAMIDVSPSLLAEAGRASQGAGVPDGGSR